MREEGAGKGGGAREVVGGCRGMGGKGGGCGRLPKSEESGLKRRGPFRGLVKKVPESMGSGALDTASSPSPGGSSPLRYPLFVVIFPFG